MTSISLVTSCFNAAKLLPVTLRSIRQQSLRLDPKAKFEYIIVDAASTDNSLELINEAVADLPIKIISEPDKGVYDGLSKGFTQCTGDIVGYINAGDFLFPTALETVRDAFTDTTASWMTGYSTLSNEKWQPWRVDLPFRFRKSFFLNGLHGTRLPTLQQESTFWRRELMAGLDWRRFRELKLAGDFLLWQHFSRSEPPAILHSLVGAFCAHAGQLSEDNSDYVKELRSLCRQPTPAELALAQWDRILWKSPQGIKRRLGGSRHIAYDPALSKYVFK
jgi:glycosyltransferase involved in cell wall biosynthesis